MNFLVRRLFSGPPDPAALTRSRVPHHILVYRELMTNTFSANRS